MNMHIRLREERERLGLTLARMAEIGGVKPRAYSYYEAGERVPDAAFLAKIAEVDVNDQKVDVFYILTGQRIVSKQKPAPLTDEGIEAIVNYKREHLTADEAALVKEYRQSAPEVQAAAHRMMKPEAIKKPASMKIRSGELPDDKRPVKERLKVRSGVLPEKKFKPPKIRGGDE